MVEVVIQSGPPQAEITLLRGQTDPATIVNPAPVELVITRQVGDAPPSAGGISPFQHTQLQASDVWVINHNMGRRPVAVTVMSLGFQQMGADVQNPTENQTRVTFVEPQTGYVRII